MQSNFEQVIQQIEALPLSQKQALRKLLDDQIASSSNKLTAEEKRDKWRVWIKANREEYGGMYVALDSDILLGTGKNYSEAFQAAKHAGVTDAFVDFIPPIGYVGEIGGWE